MKIALHNSIFLLTLQLFFVSAFVFSYPERLSAADATRVWTGNGGKKIEAELLDVKGDTAKFRKKDGSTVSAKIAIFSKDDQHYIKNFEKQKGAKPTTPKEPIVARISLADLPEAEVREKLEGVPIGRAECFFPTNDGRFIVTGEIENRQQSEAKYEIVFWNIAQKKAEKTFVIPSPSLAAAAFSSDDRTLLLGLFDGELLSFETQTNKNVTWKPNTELLCSIAISPDGKYAVSDELRKNEITVSEIRCDAKPKSRLLSSFGREQVGNICFDNTGELLAITYGNNVAVWEWKARKELWSAKGPSRAARRLVHDPHTNRLISSGFSGDILVWDMKSGQKEAEFSCEGYRPLGVALSADGRFLSTTGKDSTNKKPSLSFGI